MATTTIPQAARLRVYLVEDSPIIVRLLRDLIAAESSLRLIGQSKAADTALLDIASLRPDIVILDLSLSDSSGFDVLEVLTSWPRVERPVVVILSNYASDPFRERAFRLNADYFFDKSHEIVRMLRVLSDIAVSRHEGIPDPQRHGEPERRIVGAS